MDASLPYVSIKPNYFTTYIRSDSTHSGKYQSGNPFEPPTDKRHHGIMSYKANKRVRTAIDWLVHLAEDKTAQHFKRKKEFKFKLSFITLTLSSKQQHSDNEIKAKLLNQFLTELREKYKTKYFLWRAESQSNGNIHFHICSDAYVPWRSLRTDWNRIQNKLGYVDRYTANTGLKDPNSTDIHAISKIKNLPAYLAKYCGKNSKGYIVQVSKVSATRPKPPSYLTYEHPQFNNEAKFFRQIHGNLWGLSQSLSAYKSAAAHIHGLIDKEIEWLRNTFKDKVKYVERATLFFFESWELAKYKCFGLYNKFKEYALDPRKKPPNLVGVAQDLVNEVLKAPVFKQSILEFLPGE